MVIFSYTHRYDKVKSVSVRGPAQLATKYRSLKATYSLERSVLVGVWFYFTFTLSDMYSGQQLRT